MRLLLRIVVAAALTASVATAGAAPSAFDGAWNLTLTCPPHNAEDDEARG